VKFVTPLMISLAMATQVQAKEGQLESVLVTGTYSERTATTSSVSVLDAGEIRALGKRSVADLLKTLPGLLVEEQGGPGGLTAVSIRGGEANFTLVLLDGVPVNDPTNTRGGGLDFANLNSTLVERIEVVRGTQSTIYGSDAVAGVINIVTRRPAQGHSQSARAEVGEDGYYSLGFGARGQLAEVDYTIDLSRRDDGDPTPGSERESDSANINIGWRVNEKNELKTLYRYVEGDRTSYPEQSGGPLYAVVDDLDDIDYEDQLISLGWRYEINPGWTSNLSLSRFEHDETFLSPGVFPYTDVPPNATETDFTRDQLRWVNSIALAESYHLDVGADYRDEDGESVGYLEYFGNQLPTNFELDRSSNGVFVDITAQPSEGVLLRGSVRHDEPEDFDSETSWQLGSSLELDGGVSLSANWGEAYKLPSFFALGHALVGNADLKPEQGESWDIGLHWQANEELGVGVTWFNNDYEDLVDFDETTFQNVNRNNVETEGAEVEALWEPGDGFRARFSGTYTDIDVKGEDTVLTGRPEWLAGVVLVWQLAEDWSSALDYRYVGEQWATSLHTGDDLREELDGYHRVDLSLRWQLVPAWLVQLALDNALDEDYETAVGFEGPGRAVRLGVQFTH
jgi:vitamin B12 transporter